MAIRLLSNIHAHCSNIPMCIIGVLYEVMYYYLTRFFFFCVHLEDEFELARLAPFGTYFYSQRKSPTKGEGNEWTL